MTVEQSAYVSREDSELLRQALSVSSGEFLLEIGLGYGSNLESAIGNFKTLVGTDIRRDGVYPELARSNLDIIIAETATCFRTAVFDTVAMNPPYLPSEMIDDLATDGGRGGFEVPQMFLDEALRVLKSDGRALIVLSSETNLRLFEEYCMKNSISFKKILQRKLFFETLFVFELRKTQRK
jgi:release factor glutamine methyltransferase